MYIKLITENNINLGKVKAGERKMFTFEVYNNTDILQSPTFAKTCPCLSWGKNKVLSPKSQTKYVVTFITNNTGLIFRPITMYLPIMQKNANGNEVVVNQHQFTINVRADVV